MYAGVKTDPFKKSIRRVAPPSVNLTAEWDEPREKITWYPGVECLVDQEALLELDAILNRQPV